MLSESHFHLDESHHSHVLVTLGQICLEDGFSPLLSLFIQECSTLLISECVAEEIDFHLLLVLELQDGFF